MNLKKKDKLAQALSNVWIGNCRVWAREARFDRFAQFDVDPRVSSNGVREGEAVAKDRKVVRKRGEGEENIKREGKKAEGKRVEKEKMIKVGNNRDGKSDGLVRMGNVDV